MAIDEKEIALRLFLAFLIGAIIGTERKVRHKPAGLRTHALVGWAPPFLQLSAFMVLQSSVPNHITGRIRPG